jgi:hypothetical protein
VKVSEIAAKYHLREDTVSKILAEFQGLGMVTLSEDSSAVVRSSSPEHTPLASLCTGGNRGTGCRASP